MQHLYCLHSRDQKKVKIGRTKDVARRIAELSRDHGELYLFHHYTMDVVEKTMDKLEKAVHYHYREHHLHGEWFSEVVLETFRDLDFKAVRAAYRDSRWVEIRLPKHLAGLPIEQILSAATQNVCKCASVLIPASASLLARCDIPSSRG